MADPQKTEELAQKNAKRLDKFLKNLERDRSGKKGVGGSFDRKSINNMRAMTRKSSADFIPDDRSTLGALGGAVRGGVSDLKERAVSMTPGGGLLRSAVRFKRQKGLVKKAKKDQLALRKSIKEMFDAAKAKNKSGGEALEAIFAKAVKGSDDPGAFIDILIQLGATTEDEMESLLETYGSGDFDENALTLALSERAEQAGLTVAGGSFGLGLKKSGMGMAAPRGGADISPSSPYTGGPITGKPSGDGITKELVRQTVILRNIEKLLTPDKLQSREDKLEASRRKKASGDATRAASMQSGKGTDEEGGGGLLGSLIEGLATAAGLGGLGLFGRGKKPVPFGPQPKPKGKLGKLLGFGKKVGAGALKIGGTLLTGLGVGKLGGLAAGAVGGASALALPAAAVAGAAAAGGAAGYGLNKLGGAIFGEDKFNDALINMFSATPIGFLGRMTGMLATSKEAEAGVAADTDFNAESQRLSADKSNSMMLAKKAMRIARPFLVRGEIDKAIQAVSLDPEFISADKDGLLSAMQSLNAQSKSAGLKSISDSDLQQFTRETSALTPTTISPISTATSTISSVEQGRASSGGGGNNTSVVAPTVNSGNSTTTNTTINGVGVGNNEPSAAMANALAKYGGFSSPRFA
jgi:hypothetical protein